MCGERLGSDITAADEATKAALAGSPFRDAYLAVKEKTGSATPEEALRLALAKKTLGAPGNRKA